MCIVFSDFVPKHVGFIVFEARQVLPPRGSGARSDSNDDI